MERPSVPLSLSYDDVFPMNIGRTNFPGHCQDKLPDLVCNVTARINLYCLEFLQFHTRVHRALPEFFNGGPTNDYGRVWRQQACVWSV